MQYSENSSRVHMRDWTGVTRVPRGKRGTCEEIFLIFGVFEVTRVHVYECNILAYSNWITTSGSPPPPPST